MNAVWTKMSGTVYVAEHCGHKLRVWLSRAFWLATVDGNKLRQSHATPGDAKRAASKCAGGVKGSWY
jgi:hypothetical protein